MSYPTIGQCCVCGGEAKAISGNELLCMKHASTEELVFTREGFSEFVIPIIRVKEDEPTTG
jgi:hypothetical protein